MTCDAVLRAGATCGRQAGHSGQHRTARAAAKRNRRKRLDSMSAAILRDVDGVRDGRKTRTMSSDDLARQYRDLGPSDDDYYERKRAAGLI
jgi:hypothetical protein